jgi:hypothetical protein
MESLFNTIRLLAAEDKYLIGQHASERLEERHIMEWQAVAGLDDGVLIAERPDASPNPAIEVERRCPMGPNSKPCGRIWLTAVWRSW